MNTYLDTVVTTTLFDNENYNFVQSDRGIRPLRVSGQCQQFHATKMELEQIWPVANYITLHTPLIESTRSNILFSFEFPILSLISTDGGKAAIIYLNKTLWKNLNFKL